MKKLVFGLVLLAFCSCILKKRTAEPANDPALDKRLGEFLQHYKELDMDKLVDYLYPKLFTIAPRDTVLNRMKRSIASDDVSVSFDSVKINTMYPVFAMDSRQYAKISYSMVLVMDLHLSNDSTVNSDTIKLPKGHAISADMYPAPRAELMSKILMRALLEKYGENLISMDEATGIAKIRATSELVAIKDKYAKEWSFLNLKAEDSVANNILLGKKVLDKLAAYK